MFFRLFVLASSLFFNLYACKGDYVSCIAKVKDSQAIQKNFLSIPITKKRRLVYAKHLPKTKILKYDPFLSLYLVEDKQPFQYPFDINMRLQLTTAIVTDKVAKKGHFIHNEIGLNTLARYSKKLATPALVTNSCCSLEGIVTQRGVIQKEYLKHFIESKTVQYGDIGIRVRDKNGDVVVSASDPFMKENPFKKGDIIVAFDAKKIKSAAFLMRKILFCKINTKHSVKVKRGSKYITYKVSIAKRLGGGALSDTFFERKGLYFDKRLSLVKITPAFQKYGLHRGDRLIQINGVLVKNQKELREHLEKFKNYSSLLFERNGFEFFVNIK
ncbi:FIG00638667: hypothetical protein [hydrothermal vent metagenome]|uniref:Uncharacterized protein n=1 Tax=hydrothermal vent metagenome TaxID=652676 RepID=A0A1W1BF01_9ZZZZ